MLDWFKTPLVRLVGLGVLFTTLLGCFEVREEITIHKNRSGTYSLAVDMGRMADMMQGAGDTLAGALGGDESGEAQPEAKPAAKPESQGPQAEMDEDMVKKMKVLEGLKGISDVKAFSDGSTGLSFSFASLDALKTALRFMDMDEETSTPGESPFVFTRRSITRGSSLGLGFDGYGDEPEGLMMMAAMEPSYTFKLTVPRKIRQISNDTGATLSIDRKTLTVTAPIAEVLAGEMDLTNEIRYR